MVDDSEWDAGVELMGKDSLGDFSVAEAVYGVRKFPRSLGTGSKNGEDNPERGVRVEGFVGV